MWLHFVHLLMLENLFYKSGAVFSLALIRSMAEGNAGAGGISGAVESLKWARPSKLLICITLPWLPTRETRESYASECVEGHPEKPSVDVIRWSAWSVLLLTARLLCTDPLRAYFLSCVPWGTKPSSPLLFLPNLGTEIHTLSLSELRKCCFFFCFALYEGNEPTMQPAQCRFLSRCKT